MIVLLECDCSKPGGNKCGDHGKCYCEQGDPEALCDCDQCFVIKDGTCVEQGKCVFN